MSVTASDAAAYLQKYIASYRREYNRFVAPPPIGAGYPALQISPFLYSEEFVCHLTDSGAAIADFSWEPPHDWYITGGPALLIDFPETRTPPAIIELLASKDLLGKDIGLYRIVANVDIPEEIWRGSLPDPVESAESIANGTRIKVFKYDIAWDELIGRLTLGAFGKILDLHLPNKDSEFWNPRIIGNLGFVTADRENKRFYHYLEFLPHTEPAAWDPRTIWVRVHNDVGRDFMYAATPELRRGGSIRFEKPEVPIPPIRAFHDHLAALGRVIDDFAKLVDERGDEDEAIFHSYLQANPILIDIYGEVVSKPRFRYPCGESPLGKEYVEPDFIVRYPWNAYRLVELERPSKRIATKRGEPTAALGQAAFQVAEWKTYIQKHYDLIKREFPGIFVSCSSMIVISRSSQRSFGEGRGLWDYMELVKNQFRVDEVFTYDDLLQRAKEAYIRLVALA